jgi:hypothetical protein
MKKCAVVFGGFFLAAFALYATQDNSPGPNIVFDSLAKDFGKVIEGAPLKHIFKFTNKGSATLEISKVEPG